MEMQELDVSYRVERRCEFHRGVVEIRRYFWSKPVEQSFQGIKDALVLNMALTSRPKSTKVERIAPGREAPSHEAGRLLVMMPGGRYHVIAPSGAFRSLHCALDCEMFEELLGEPVDWRALGDLGGVLRPGTGTEWLLTRMCHELDCARIGQSAAIEAYANALCIEVARRFRPDMPASPEILRGGLATWRMKALLDRVQRDGPFPRLDELAKLCGLTTRQLGRAFKAETGMTIGRYIDQVTMERAHRLLTSTDRTLGEIARELGFASADSFAQSYRRITGIMPSRARKLQVPL